MDIDLTRAIVHAALLGQLEDAEYVQDKTFHILIPRRVPGVPSDVLFPRDTWDDKEDYDRRAKRLAADFCAHFDKTYGSKSIDPAVATECPGR